MKRLFLLQAVLFIGINAACAAEKPSEILTRQFIADYALLTAETEQLSDLIVEADEDWERIEKQFFQTRLAYKKIEIFFNYLDHEYVKDFINGAPLPKIERKAPSMVIFDPQGFQILEEVIFEREKDAFEDLAGKLHEKTKKFQTYLDHMRMTERMVFEAMRESVIRLAAMGISGFDSPEEVNALAECKVVMASQEQTVLAYSDYLNRDDLDELHQLFATGRTYFEDTDFIRFNRFGYIKKFINPLYKKLLDLHHQLHIETRDLVIKSEFAVNYEADNIFDSDFLNYRYFSKYSNSGDQEKRKELGKLLFFDPILSHNNERACASCHQPEKAFTDGQKTSLAFNGEGHLDRNSPGLINAVFNTRFFWDARAETPEDQIEHVLFSPKEFNTNYDEITEKIESCETYIALFNAAYPEFKSARTKLISRYTIVASISAYIQSLYSFNSKFDREIKSQSETTDQSLINGFNLFAGKGKCATCHFIPTFAGNLPPLYNDTETEVLGVPKTGNRSRPELDDDLGRYANGRPKERAGFYQSSFKTATLRNIELTAPYMHNGVFETLEEVVDFYNVGGGHGWGIAPENTTLGSDSLHLTEQEIDDLILFMRSLTDTVGLTSQPGVLPESTQLKLNGRTIGGKY